MENSIANRVVTLSSTSSIEEISQYLRNLALAGLEGSNSLNSKPLAYPFDGSSAITQLASGTGINHSFTAPTPLYSQDKWAVNSSGESGSSNLQPRAGYSQLLSFNYGNPHDNRLQTGLVNRGKELLRNSAANFVPVPQGGRDLYPGISNVKPFVGLVNQEFLESRVGHSELLECYSFLAEALSQEGSRKIREMLKAEDPETTTKIFEKAYLVPYNLMCDPYGGHVLTGLIAACSESELRLIMLKIYENPGWLVNAACNRFGSRTIQRLIKLLKRSPLISVVTRILSDRYLELMVHSIGRSVVLECVRMLKPEQLELLYEQAIDSWLELAQHKEGCISLNELITSSQGGHREILQHLISCHAVPLSYHPLGNYVVQNVLDLGSPRHVLEICFRLKNHYAKLSFTKAGSHVVEKCLNSKEMNYVVEGLLQSNQLGDIARDVYGNYVIQTALKATKDANKPLHRQLLVKLQQHPNALSSSYGKNVLRLIRQWGSN